MKINDNGIVLCNPKFGHNVGAAIRGASCFGVEHVFFTGNRIPVDHPGYRLPREERMKGYKDVEWKQHSKPLDLFDPSVVPVAIEFRPNSELLDEFIHPEKAVYVFGPEDGNIDKGLMHCCHRFVAIPTRHCLNLSIAVNIVLYDRIVKQRLRGIKETYHYHPTEHTLEPAYQEAMGKDER